MPMNRLAHVCVLVLFVLREVLSSRAFDAHCFNRHGRPRSFLRLVPGSNDRKPLEDLLQRAGKDSKKCDIASLSGGFCNSLHKVTCGDEQMVAKVFSEIARRRMPLHNRHYIDWLASEHGLGPKLFTSTEDGILMEWLDEVRLDEPTVHHSSEWIQAVAPRVAAFHYMEIPDPPNMLWHTMDVMLTMINDDDSLVKDKVLRQRESIEPLELPTVLGHGDLKPSNILWGGAAPHFIDLEIAGMHYRAFDLAKLFRTNYPSAKSAPNLEAFIECYLRSCPVPTLDMEVDLLRLEVKLMEPLTWLEAAVFFACSAIMDQANSEKWNRLATDRLNCYDASIVGHDSCIAEYREKRLLS